MTNRLNVAFPCISENDCLETYFHNRFWIYDCDDEYRCYVKTDEDQFCVINESENNIYFLAIDKCMFSDTDQFEKCDCAVFNDEVFAFIEIKKSKKRTKSQNKKKAKSQLISTINVFKEKVEFNVPLEAYLCIGDSPKTPAKSATSSDMLLEFEEMGVSLFEGCQKEF